MALLIFLLKISMKNFIGTSNAKERVRAIIFVINKIVLIERIKLNDNYFVIPGGGVEKKESHEEALKRECREELGVSISVKRFFSKKTSNKKKTKGHLEFFYICDIEDGKLGTGIGPEFQGENHSSGKYIVREINLEDLAKIDLRPKEIKIEIINYLKNK